MGWSPRTARPSRCPNCKSIRWDVPRASRVQRGLGIEDIIGSKREELLRLGRKHRLHDLRVFGSVARGDATERSDVDLLVTPDPGLGGFETFGELADFQEDASRLLRRRVDAHTTGAFPPKSPALKEARVL